MAFDLLVWILKLFMKALPLVLFIWPMRIDRVVVFPAPFIPRSLFERMTEEPVLHSVTRDLGLLE